MAIKKMPNGRYLLDWWVSRKRYYQSFDTKHEADDYRTEIKQRKKTHSYVAPDKVLTFPDAAGKWLARRQNRAPGTYDQYAGQIKRHLLPKFGQLRLGQISDEAIEEWREELAQTGTTAQRRKGLAPRTIAGLMKTLTSILERAVRRGQLTSNPAKKLDPAYNPTRGRDEGGDDIAVSLDEIYNLDELRRLLAAAEPGRYRMLFTLAAATGARSGELFALRWSDILFEGRPRIYIRRSLSWAKGPDGNKSVARFRPPKTKAGLRDIPIDALVVRALKAWKLQAGRNDLDLVFADANGMPMQRSLMLKYSFWRRSSGPGFGGSSSIRCVTRSHRTSSRVHRAASLRLLLRSSISLGTPTPQSLCAYIATGSEARTRARLRHTPRNYSTR
jgi:integrase